jgi:hypothetical protein
LPWPWDPLTDPLLGLVEAAPLLPEPLLELLEAVAGPVEPVLPDWVFPEVSALPDLALELEFELVSTEPDCPPFPELPEVATGLEEALPVSVDPVEPVLPEVAPWWPLGGWWPLPGHGDLPLPDLPLPGYWLGHGVDPGPEP